MSDIFTADLLRGHTDSIVLKLLSDGDKYGYEMMKLVIDLTSKMYELREPTLYSSLRRLEKDGLITSYWGNETRGGRRKYYQITVGGWAQYQENIRNWKYSQEILNKLLED